jgi:hypothetical protein
MIGLIQRVLFDLVEEKGGRRAVEKVKERAGVPADKIFRIGEVYPDDEWLRLLAATCEVLGVSETEAMEAYAETFGRDALTRFPKWFEMSANSRQFLERQIAIHNMFASGLRDPEARRAVTDKFRIETRDDEIVTHYRSPNQLCTLYVALARWMFRHYGDEATIEQSRCMHRGDEECEIHVRWKKLRGTS